MQSANFVMEFLYLLQMIDSQIIKQALKRIEQANHIVAFTGAGISVESGIPPFRGKNGIWNKYDPRSLELDFFYRHPKESWLVIREIFYSHFNKATPNMAHYFLAELEKRNKLNGVITQNIDNLHQDAGSKKVFEFHGNSKMKKCTVCQHRTLVSELDLQHLPVMCAECGALTKPDFVFFGEGIPEQAYEESLKAARTCDVMLIVGALGEVMPAANMPYEAKRKGAYIIEVNPEPSNFTNQVTDLFIPSKAAVFFSSLKEVLESNRD